MNRSSCGLEAETTGARHKAPRWLPLRQPEVLAGEAELNLADGLAAAVTGAGAEAQMLAGAEDDAIADSDLAMRLSPLDPMLSAMCGVRAGAHSLQGDYEQAARWAEKGASAPGSHGILLTLTAAYHQLSGNRDRALFWAEKSRAELPNLTKETFFQSLPFSNSMSMEKMSSALDKLGY